MVGISEHRKHPRLLPAENAFAALGRKYHLVGKVRNISLGGLALEYIIGEIPDSTISSVNIFLVGNTFRLHDIPCRLIYDIHLPPDNQRQGTHAVLATSFCGLQFGPLTNDDICQLEYFLDTHTQPETCLEMPD